MLQFFDDLNLKEFLTTHKKELIFGLLALLLIEGAAIYYLFFYISPYNIGLTGEQIKSFKQSEIALIEKEYQQKIAETNSDILTQKTQCSVAKSSGIVSDLEAKKRQAAGEEEINRLNKEADAKIAAIQKECAKEYAPILKKAIATLEGEKNSKIWSVRMNPVSKTSVVENIPASSGQPINAGSDGSIKTEIISSDQAKDMQAVKGISPDANLELMKQSAANDPNYQPADFNTMPGQSGGGIPVY